MKGYEHFSEDLKARAVQMRQQRDDAMKRQRDDIARKKSESNQRDSINKAKDEIKRELGM